MFSFFNSPRARVRRGVRLLDSYDRDWFNKVDLTQLRMDSDTRCIVGQVTGISYSLSVYDLGIRLSQGRHYGFNADWDPLGENWQDLDWEWRRVIANKRSKHLQEAVDA